MAVKREVKVGLFVAIGLAVAGLIIFLIGDASRMFETKAKYTAAFEDVEGLGAGAPILMGGVNIGHVTSVQFPTDEQRSEVIVEFAIVRSEARRIRMDSRASVAPKGLLGDKLIEITKGSVGEAQLPDGSLIPSQRQQGLMARVEGLGEKADNVLGNLEKTSGTFAEESFRQDVQMSVRSVRSVLESLDTGQGYVPRLLHDQEEADRLSHTVATLERTATELNQVLGQLQKTVSQVNNGPGFAHDVLYGDQGTKTIEQIGGAADEVAKTLVAIREGDGLAKRLLFGGEHDDDTDRAIADLAAITSDLRAITHEVKEGKGTLGALLADPSVYEDLKVLLGNAQRNEVLRALVRYSIKRDEAGGAPKPHDPSPASVSKSE
ncbi:MAG TPA: MlaD family protein [Polyangiaceae bacterium]|nr:MlaD family protein [Polyangiaceae bacterium]